MFMSILSHDGFRGTNTHMHCMCAWKYRPASGAQSHRLSPTDSFSSTLYLLRSSTTTNMGLKHMWRPVFLTTLLIKRVENAEHNLKHEHTEAEDGSRWEERQPKGELGGIDRKLVLNHINNTATRQWVELVVSK